MAIGDYDKTIYKEDHTVGMSVTRMNSIENKVDELDKGVETPTGAQTKADAAAAAGVAAAAQAQANAASDATSKANAAQAAAQAASVAKSGDTMTGDLSFAAGKGALQGSYGKMWIPPAAIGILPTYTPLWTYNAKYEGAWKILGGGRAVALGIYEGYLLVYQSQIGSAGDVITWTEQFRLSPDLSALFPGQVNIGDDNGFIRKVGNNSVEVANLVGALLLSSGATGTFMCFNCRFDGTNWNRIDTAQPAWLSGVLSTGPVYYYATAGANPISPWSSSGEMITSKGEQTIANRVSISGVHPELFLIEDGVKTYVAIVDAGLLRLREDSEGGTEFLQYDPSTGFNFPVSVTIQGYKAVTMDRLGALSTSGGTLDWNAHTLPGTAPVLLHGTHTNGPGVDSYFHCLNIEYGPGRTGTGEITQLAIPYADSTAITKGIYARGRYVGVWSPWYGTFHFRETNGVLEYYSGGVWKPVTARTFTQGTFSTTQDTLQTALSLSVPGSIVYVNAIAPASLTGGEVKITLDGTVLTDLTSISASTAYSLMTPDPTGGVVFFKSGAAYYPPALQLEWKTSLLIQVKSDGTRTLPVYWGYNT